MTVWYGNDAFSMLVLSTKKRYSCFLKKVFIFQKICFKVKVLKTFKVFTAFQIFGIRSYRTNSQNSPPLTKDYLDFCFSFSLEQLISIPAMVTSNTVTLIDVLTNSFQKVSQCGVIEFGISDHDLVYCTRKTPSLTQ